MASMMIPGRQSDAGPSPSEKMDFDALCYEIEDAARAARNAVSELEFQPVCRIVKTRAAARLVQLAKVYEYYLQALEVM